MKVLIAFLALAVLTASAGHYQLCGYSDTRLRLVSECIAQRASMALRTGLLTAKDSVNCLHDACLYRKLCDTGNIGKALEQYFSPELIEELHEVAHSCEE
ncbi:antimicrobial peptide microplusin-like [Haemaphysalis longicornis]